MNRDRIITVLLGSFIGLGVVGLFGYLLFWDPYQEKTAAIAKLESDVAEKTSKKEANEKANLKLKTLNAVSLPPEPNTAQREYDFVLTQVLNRAGVPAGARTVNVKLPPDKSTIPLVNPGAANKDKKYAYQKVTAEITMTKVTLDSLTTFLTSYHKLGILQHITKLTVKLSDSDVGGSAGRRGGGGVDRVRSDLTVNLTTEAIIMDGIEPRESIVKIPVQVRALGGAAVYYLLDTNPDVGRKLALNRPFQSLPSEQLTRDYLVMKYKDPFHGNYPPPPPPVRQEDPLPPAPLPSVDRYVKMSGWTTRSDGTGVVDITDIANNITYQIRLERKGEKLHTVIFKQRVTGGVVVPFTLVRDTDIKSWVDKPFVISDATVATEATSSTHRTFKVHGVVPMGLILSSPVGDDKPAAPAPRGGGGFGRGGQGRGGFGGGAPATRFNASPVEVALASFAGSAVTSVFKPESYFVWTVGQSLSDLKEVPKGDVNTLLKHALDPLMPGAETTISSPTGSGR